MPILLAILSIAAAWILGTAFTYTKITIPWWVEAPSVKGFYGIFYGIYNRALWHKNLGPIHFSEIPNLNGVWKGVLASSYDKSKEYKVVVLIDQTWSEVLMRLQTATSLSHSTMAALNTGENSIDLSKEI